MKTRRKIIYKRKTETLMNFWFSLDILTAKIKFSKGNAVNREGDG